jgi:hypothetical protein
MNHQDRAAGIAMGSEPDALRACLQATKRQSLRLIHAHDFPRFTSAGKPTRRAAAKKPPPDTPQTDRAYATLVEAQRLGQELPGKKELAKQLGLSHMAVEKAWDRLHRENESLPDLESLSPSSKARAERTILAYKKAILRNVNAMIYAEARKIIDQADFSTRKGLSEANAKIRELEKQNWDLRQTLARRGIFTKAEFRQLQMCVHPDTVNSVSTEIRNHIIDLITRNEQLLMRTT